MDQILQAPSYEDKKDQLLRAFAGTWQTILKFLNRADSLKLWSKLHSLFQLKLDSEVQARRMIEPLTVSDLQEELFKVDTFFTKEHAALEYALNKLEAQRTETKEQFDNLIQQTDTIATIGGIDSQMTVTQDLLSRNKDGLRQNGKAFEQEMQQRFQAVNESIKKLKY